jgi:hypothetical protein
METGNRAASACGFAVGGLAMPRRHRHILRARSRLIAWNNCCDKAFKLRRKWSAPDRLI